MLSMKLKTTESSRIIRESNCLTSINQSHSLNSLQVAGTGRILQSSQHLKQLGF